MNEKIKQASDGERPIDKNAQEVVGWWKKNLVYVTKTRIRTWKGVLVIAFFAGLATAFIWAVNLDFYSASDAANSRLYFDPGSVALHMGDEVDLDVVINTGGSKIVAARALISYDTSKLEVVSWNLDNSVFSVQNSCVYENSPCRIISHDTDSGILDIVLAKPTPGVNTDSGTFASIKVRALTEFGQSSDYLKLSYVSSGSYDDSDMILDDGLGTDILNGVGSLLVQVVSPEDELPEVGDVVLTGEEIVEEPDNISENEIVAPKIKIGGASQKLNSSDKLYVKKKEFSIKSRQEELRNGRVVLKKDGKTISEINVDGEGNWKIETGKQNDGDKKYTLEYYDSAGNMVAEKKYEIKVDTKDPKFTDLPSVLVKRRGDKVWWKAEDDNKIKYFVYYFNGDKKKTKNASFNIPANVNPGTYMTKVKAYDKAGNKAEKRVLIIVK